MATLDPSRFNIKPGGTRNTSISIDPSRIKLSKVTENDLKYNSEVLYGKNNTPINVVKNGKISYDGIAQLAGYNNKAEMDSYKDKNPKIFAPMGGVKYTSPGAPVKNTNAINISNKAVNGLVDRFINADTNEVPGAIDTLASGEWQDADTMQKCSDIINTYANDYIALNELGYFDSVSEEEKKTNVDWLNNLKEAVKSSKAVFADYEDADSYKKAIELANLLQGKGSSLSDDELNYVMNNVKGIPINVRQNIYKKNKKRIAEIDSELEKNSWWENNFSKMPKSLKKEKEKLVAANSTFEKYGAAADLSFDELKKKQGEAKDNEDMLYYLSLANQKAYEEVATNLALVKMDGEETTVLTAMNELAEMEDGKEKRARKKIVKAQVEKAGYDFNNIYSILTDDTNVSVKNFFKFVGTKLDIGIGSWSDGMYATADLIIGKPLQAIGWENNPISKAREKSADYLANKRFDADFYADRMGNGKGMYYLGQFAEGITGAIPFLVSAYLSGGASVAASYSTLASQATMVTGSVATKAGMAMQNMASSPNFWTSFASTYGHDYEEAVGMGASEEIAILGATITSFVNAGVEIGLDGQSGIQGFTQQIKNGDTKVLYEWLKSGGQEAVEEVLQGVISRGVSKALYDSDVKVLDGKTMLEEGIIGGGVGLFLGGGQISTSYIADNILSSLHGMCYYGSSQVSVNALVNNGLAMPEGSTAYKQAVKADSKLKSGKKLSGATLYNLAAAIESEIETKSTVRLLELGVDKKTAEKLSPVVAKAVFGESLTTAEHTFLNNNWIAVYVVKELSKDRANTIWKDAIKKSRINNATDGNSVVESSGILQSDADGVVDSKNNFNYNDNSIKEGESYGKEQLRNGDTGRQFTGANTQSRIGSVQETSGGIYRNNRESGTEPKTIYNQGNNRGIELSQEQFQGLKNTAIKNEDGTPKMVYHFTNNMDFEVFAKGDIGFHFGNELQARQRGKNLKQQGRIITAFLDIKNPIYINTDLMSWYPAHVAVKLYADGIITYNQYKNILGLHIESGYEYNSPAAVNLRKILADLGYDGIVYENHYEGDGQSYIAFYPEQIIIIDDGKTYTNQAISENEVAFLNSKEKQIAADEYIQGLRGEDDKSAAEQGEMLQLSAGDDVAHGGETTFQKGAAAIDLFNLEFDNIMLESSTNAVTKPLGSYAPAKRGMIIDFLKAVDEKLKAFVERVKNGSDTFERFTITDVSDREVADIKDLLGIDVEGYTHNINTNGIKHILKRHGISGGHDHTMSNDNDIARMGWVINNYDNVELLFENGEVATSDEFRDTANRRAPQIRYSKKINGTYYVVEAVFENNYNKLWVQSAYLSNEKEVVTRDPDAADRPPMVTPETPVASPTSNSNISQSQKSVNDKYWREKSSFANDNMQAIIEAVYGDSLKFSNNEVLQSSVGGVVDSVNKFNYNDNSIKEGEKNDIYKRRGFEPGNEETSETINSGKETGMAGIYGENSLALKRRVEGIFGESGRTVPHLNITVAYKETGENDENSPAGIAYNILKSKGYNAVYCEGPILINNNKYTIERTEAVTIFDGTIYISSEATLNGKGIALHEVVHVWQYDNNAEYSNYESVLYEEIDPLCDNYTKLAAQINDNHYNGKYDIGDIGSFKFIMRELAAYINQYVNTDIEYAWQKFSGAFKNFDNVVQAVYNLNNTLGFYDIKNKATSQSEAAVFLPENSDLNKNGTNANGIDDVSFINGLFGKEDKSNTGWKDTVKNRRISSVDSNEIVNYNESYIKKGESYGREQLRDSDIRRQLEGENTKGSVGSVQETSGGVYGDSERGWWTSQIVRNQGNNRGIELSQEHKVTILRYKSGEAYTINAKLRENETLDELEQYFVNVLNEALQQLPVYEGTVYRNVVFDDFGGEEAYRQFLEQYIPNRPVPYKQFLSCSKEQDGYPVEGQYQVHFVIESKNARDVDGYGNNMESEVTYPINSIFIVDKILFKNNIPTIYLQEAIANVRYNTYESGVNAVRDMQAPHTVHDNLQGISRRNTDGDTFRRFRSQPATSVRQRDTVRTGGRQDAVLPTTREEQEIDNNDNRKVISENEVTSFYLEEKPANGIDADEFIKGLRGEETQDFSQEYIDELLESFGITKPGDYIHVQKRVMETLQREGFFTDKENRCTKVVNDASGMVVEINKSGIDETFNLHNYSRIGRNRKFLKLAIIRQLPEIIKYGKLIKDNVENIHEDVSVNKSFAYIRYMINIDGKAITLQIDIKKSPQKNKFWVHKIIKNNGANDFPASNEIDAEAGQRTANTNIDDQNVMSKKGHRTFNRIVKGDGTNNQSNNVEAIKLGYNKVSADKKSLSQESKNVNEDNVQATADGVVDSVKDFNYNDNIIKKEIEISQEHKATILRYKSGEAYTINAKLRENETLDESEQYFVNVLNEALQQLPVYEGTVYRNVVFDDFGGEEAYNGFLEQYAPGKPIFYKQFLSCSKERDGYPVEGEYQVHFVIESKNARDVDDFGNNMESEVIYPLDSVFAVKKIIFKNNIPTIYLQEVMVNVGYNANEERSNAVRDMQAPHTVHDNLQGISRRNTDGDTGGEFGSQSATSVRQRDTVRTGGRQDTVLPTTREEQKVVNKQKKATLEEVAFFMPRDYGYEARPKGKIGESALFSMPIGKRKRKYNYDITNKIRDTAKRINGLERPKPNEGHVLTNGNSNSIISETTNTDNALYEALDLNEQDYIQQICDNLGIEVVFENLREMVYKGENISPDGYIDAEGVIHLNLYAENPIGFVFKHELTHFGERAVENYKRFAKAVYESKAFEQWLELKTGKQYFWDALDAYKQMIAISDNLLDSANEDKITREMIADFVGEMLFTDNGSGLVALSASLETQQRNIVVRYVLQFINWLKNKLLGENYILRELVLLEDGFKKLLVSAHEIKNSDDLEQNNMNTQATLDTEVAFIDSDQSKDISFCFVRVDDADKIRAAKRMQKEGASGYEIWDKLGVIKNVFGDWVREIDISKYMFYPNGNSNTSRQTKKHMTVKKNISNNSGVLSDFVGWPEFFELFPEYKDLRTVVKYSNFEYDTVRFIVDDNGIGTLFINKKLCDEYIEKKNHDAKFYVMRELQRMIQHKEGHRIGKSFEYWKELERRGKLPFSQRLGRQLTAEDMMKYFIDNYDAEMAASRQQLRDILKRRKGEINDVIAYIPSVDPDMVIAYSNKGKLMTLREGYPLRFKQNFYKPSINTEQTEETDTAIDVLIEEKGDVTKKVKAFVLSKFRKFSEHAKEIKKDPLIKGGNSGFLQNNEDVSAYDRFIGRVKNTSEEISINDTVGRQISPVLQERLAGTIAKDKKGCPISLYAIGESINRLFKTSELGLKLGTIDAALSMHNDDGMSYARRQWYHCFEFFVDVKNPFYLKGEPYELSVNEIGLQLAEAGIISHKEYMHRIGIKYAKTGPQYDNYVPRKFRERLKELGFDSLIFENQTHDKGSMTLVVLDESQLVLVAQDGVLINDNGVSDNGYKISDISRSAKKAEENTRQLIKYIEEPKNYTMKKRKIVDKNVKIGGAVFLENSGLNAEETYEYVTQQLSDNFGVELSGYDTAGRRLSAFAVKEFADSVLKDEEGNILTFANWSLNPMDVQKAFREGFEFGDFNSALRKFFAQKGKNYECYNGTFEEFIIKSVKPLVIKLNGWNTVDMLKLLLSKGMITQIFYNKLMSFGSVNNPSFNSVAAQQLREKIDFMGYDSIIFVKDTGVCTITALDSKQIIPISKNGILNPDVNIFAEDLPEMPEGAVINPKRRTVRNYNEIAEKLLTLSDNTRKIEMLTRYMSNAGMNLADVDDNIIVGHSGLFEGDEFNIWRANSVYNAIMSYDFCIVPINSVDTAERSVSENVKEKLNGTILKDNDGRPLSLFLWNRYGDNRFRHSPVGLHLGTLAAAHDEYLAEKQKHPKLRVGEYEEYYVNMSNAYFMSTTPHEFTPREFAVDLYKNGIFNDKEYRIAMDSSGVDATDYCSAAANYINRKLRAKGFDGIIYMNENMDRGSMGVIPLAPEQLIPVTRNGVPVSNNISTKADSDNESAIFMPENKDKNFAEISQKKSVENIDESGIIKETILLTLDNLTREILKTKPPYSPRPKRWIRNGGSIVIDKSGNWIYTDSNGVTVKYIDGYPDFESAGIVERKVNIGEFRNRTSDVRKANALLADGSRKKGYVWHHSQDGQTMMLISEEIHKKFTHKGGYALIKRRK